MTAGCVTDQRERLRDCVVGDRTFSSLTMFDNLVGVGESGNSGAGAMVR